MFSYDAPVVLFAWAKFQDPNLHKNTPPAGGGLVTVIGRNFGDGAYSNTLRQDAQHPQPYTLHPKSQSVC